ncbi:hypothetical protein ONS95_011576 [Cadophora gregata]|uniref:uncharacterized protein n=1 Tax=Cadophora gregata TaxID=51156 RepID=UPI0026DACF65|nr:uncharacterized protein ONS95_011576 [Cadophora gregata]KAK0120170.1 hypothetical protein ONS95_011576 [Cadophora gregata]
MTFYTMLNAQLQLEGDIKHPTSLRPFTIQQTLPLNPHLSHRSQVLLTISSQRVQHSPRFRTAPLRWRSRRSLFKIGFRQPIPTCTSFHTDISTIHMHVSTLNISS